MFGTRCGHAAGDSPGVGAGRETDASGDDVVQHTCTWGAASGRGWTRTVGVVIELEAGNDARNNAQGEYRNELPGIGSREVITGLGDQAQLIEQRSKTGSSAQLHVLSGNVVITAEYVGTDAGDTMTVEEMRNATVAVARNILAELRQSTAAGS